jgi:competence protein ComEA
MDISLRSPTVRRALAAALLLVVVLVVAFQHLPGGHAPAVAIPPLRTAAPTHAAAAKELVVDVAGAVRRPGLYRLAPGTRIADAIARAGGAVAKGDVDLVNLAAPLADGEQVVVPERGGAGAVGASAAASPTAPLDLNSATAEQLDSLPGVGPETAAKIVAFRQAHGPFHSLEELDAVPGIGPARIAEWKGLVLP